MHHRCRVAHVALLRLVLFLLLRRPPTSPLFPYTTLFRSLSMLWSGDAPARAASLLSCLLGVVVLWIAYIEREKFAGSGLTRWHRSEEHTSELQSHLNLVCRLLLEKKKYYTPGPFIIRSKP